VNIFSAMFPVQLEVTSSVPKKLMLSHDVDPGHVLIPHVICASARCVTPCLASGTIDKIATRCLVTTNIFIDLHQQQLLLNHVCQDQMRA
jgi:hypothetical protein